MYMTALKWVKILGSLIQQVRIEMKRIVCLGLHLFTESIARVMIDWLCWGLTSQSTIFQSCRDGAIASWVINQYFRGVKCLAQGHNTADVGLEPRTSRSGVRHSITEPPRSPSYDRDQTPFTHRLGWLQDLYCKCATEDYPVNQGSTQSEPVLLIRRQSLASFPDKMTNFREKNHEE